jgi:hypothetical protein
MCYYITIQTTTTNAARRQAQEDKTMAVTVICSKTGIEFQADSKRTRNHPVITRWSQKSYSDGWYQQFDEALAAGKEAGFTTVAEYVELFAETETASKSQQAVDYAKRVLEARQRKAERIARDEAFMKARANGTWRPVEHDDNIDPRESEKYSHATYYQPEKAEY